MPPRSPADARAVQILNDADLGLVALVHIGVVGDAQVGRFRRAALGREHAAARGRAGIAARRTRSTQPSLNLFLPADVHKRDLHQLHLRAWEKGCKSLYYLRSKSLQRADVVSIAPPLLPLRDDDDCLACQ